MKLTDWINVVPAVQNGWSAAHRPVRLGQLAAGHVRAAHIVQKAADPPPPYDFVQAFVNSSSTVMVSFFEMALPSYTHYSGSASFAAREADRSCL